MIKRPLIFLGSKPIGFRCFEWLIAHADSLGIYIAGVLTAPRHAFDSGKGIEQLAMDHAIPLIASPEEIPVCEFLYSVQYHKILTGAQIARASTLAVNLHMAPLPEYRGCNQFTFALLDDKKEFGSTVHVMDARIDHGELLFEKRFPIPEHCWVQDLYDLTVEASFELFCTTMPDLLSGNYTRIPQQELVAARGTSLHYRNEMQALKRIDLNWDAATIERYIRAVSMPGFEPPYAEVGDKKVYFCNAWRPGQ